MKFKRTVLDPTVAVSLFCVIPLNSSLISHQTTLQTQSIAFYVSFLSAVTVVQFPSCTAKTIRTLQTCLLDCQTASSPHMAAGKKPITRKWPQSNPSTKNDRTAIVNTKRCMKWSCLTFFLQSFLCARLSATPRDVSPLSLPTGLFVPIQSSCKHVDYLWASLTEASRIQIWNQTMLPRVYFAAAAKTCRFAFNNQQQPLEAGSKTGQSS